MYTYRVLFTDLFMRNQQYYSFGYYSTDEPHMQHDGTWVEIDALPMSAPVSEVQQYVTSLNARDCRIASTYSLYTPESIEQGDSAEDGWEDEEGQAIETDEYDEEEGITLVDNAVRFLRDEGTAEPSCSRPCVGTWYTTGEDHDYSSGSHTIRHYHLRGFTDSEEIAIYHTLFPRNV